MCLIQSQSVVGSLIASVSDSEHGLASFVQDTKFIGSKGKASARPIVILLRLQISPDILDSTASRGTSEGKQVPFGDWDAFLAALGCTQ